MKALVLSGGVGTRLRPLSYSMPKQLVPVANEPVLFHALKALRTVGIREVGIVVSAPGTEIRAAVGDGARFDLDVTYLPQDAPRGLAHCVMIARDFLGDDDFLMYLGDNIFVGGIAEPFARFQVGRPDVQLVVTKVANPSESGVAELDHAGRVTALQEKPAHPRSDLAVTGAYFFTPAIHEAVRAIEPSWRGELEITDAVQWLVTQDRDVRAHLFAGHWKDTGTLADLLECNRLLLDGMRHDVQGSLDAGTRISGPVVVEAGATVRGSALSGPLIVGADCTIEDSYVGPFTSLGRECRLHEAGVENSILLERASVRGVRSIHASIIGRGGDIRPSRDGLTAHRLLVGDDSTIEVAT